MRIQRPAIAAAVVHTLVLAAFTFPAEWVPTRLRYWSQAYARVLFHQDWRLFAPDPPSCSCRIETQQEGGSWHALDSLHDHFIWERMSANLCRFAETGIEGDTVTYVPNAVSSSLLRMSGSSPIDDVAFRLHREGLGPACTIPKGTEEFIPVRRRIVR
jgi:hypothetical protein